MRISSVGVANSLTDLDEVRVPLIINTRTETDGSKKYHGFVPGIMMPDVIGTDIEEVKKELDVKAKEKIKEMLKDSTPFPFFPDEQHIYEDFDDVEYIKFYKLK